ncbi:multidrug ABC transporter ATPase [Microbacterium mangrovi]|uniref:Multidrug ABC transporter ATPase n=1 Tax=Microbacterium mangrovi TaxID=1348253 RepID=A0A0B2A281_9MICO|nr:ATP-binding cassette domain-containing protein [Microbacterium mangrovi]KHK97146.1 multidrug ABC transporter ATPase [Microbacterium mangrovi]
MSAIEVVDVSVVSEGTTLLPPTSAIAASGEAVIVRGRNGTGKSTLLRVLAGAQRPTTGSVRVAGSPVSARDRAFRRRVAAMIGLPPAARDLTVRDHVALVAATWDEDGGAPYDTADGILNRLGMTGLGARFPQELSSGQTQLFGLCLVLARPCEVLILDEPEQRLDPERLAMVIDVLADRRARGTTLVIATHSPVLAARMPGVTIDLDRAA